MFQLQATNRKKQCAPGLPLHSAQHIFLWMTAPVKPFLKTEAREVQHEGRHPPGQSKTTRGRGKKQHQFITHPGGIFGKQFHGRPTHLPWLMPSACISLANSVKRYHPHPPTHAPTHPPTHLTHECMHAHTHISHTHTHTFTHSTTAKLTSSSDSTVKHGSSHETVLMMMMVFRAWPCLFCHSMLFVLSNKNLFKPLKSSFHPSYIHQTHKKAWAERTDWGGGRGRGDILIQPIILNE